MNLQDLMDIAAEWGVDADRVGVPGLTWIDDGSGGFCFAAWAYGEDRAADADQEQYTNVDTSDGAAPPHPQGTGKLSPDGNPA